MYSNGSYFRVIAGFAASASVIVGVTAVEAQVGGNSLFDHLNLKLEGSWVAMTTEIRLDSETLGRGTAINFENDLNLGSSETIPTVAFEWQIAPKHKIGVRWQDISRNSTAAALTEIRWGDDIIPVDSDIKLGFDITQTFVDYAYYPWVKENWASGFGVGVRVLDLSATLSWTERDGFAERQTEASGTGPLPYLYFEHRRMLSDHWRLIAGLGWLYVEIDDIKGGQWIGRAGFEYLLGSRWAFGGALNLAEVDVDWAGLKDRNGQKLLTGSVNLGINDVSVFLRVRF